MLWLRFGRAVNSRRLKKFKKCILACYLAIRSKPLSWTTIMLSLEFTGPVLIAITIGLPVSFLISREWLSEFSERIDLSWWYFVSTGLIALLVSYSAVALKTITAARMSVLKGLREE